MDGEVDAEVVSRRTSELDDLAARLGDVRLRELDAGGADDADADVVRERARMDQRASLGEQRGVGVKGEGGREVEQHAPARHKHHRRHPRDAHQWMDRREGVARRLP